MQNIPYLLIVVCCRTGEKGKKLECEGNLYFDKSKCGIGYHGDAERIKVAAIRIGSMPLVYSWFYKHKAVGDRFYIDLDDGDFYVMSEIATGNKWKSSSIPTLRHAAGCAFYTALQKKHIKNISNIKIVSPKNKNFNKNNDNIEMNNIYATDVDIKGKKRKNKNIKSGKCIFPFNYSRKLHNKCIEMKDGNKWCATQVNPDNKMLTWGYCNFNKDTINNIEKHLKEKIIKTTGKGL